jgi:hypothetical protein
MSCLGARGVGYAALLKAVPGSIPAAHSPTPPIVHVNFRNFWHSSLLPRPFIRSSLYFSRFLAYPSIFNLKELHLICFLSKLPPPLCPL